MIVSVKRLWNGVEGLAAIHGFQERSSEDIDRIRVLGICIDVGVSRDADGKLSGDMDFEPISEVAGMITPVPGGVGAVTTTILLAHTVEAAERTSA